MITNSAYSSCLSPDKINSGGFDPSLRITASTLLPTYTDIVPTNRRRRSGETCSNHLYPPEQKDDRRGSRKMTEYVSPKLNLFRRARSLKFRESQSLDLSHHTTSHLPTSTSLNIHSSIIPTCYIIHESTSRYSARMNFFNLPLEARPMVYENVLQEEHHFFRDGVPGLLSARLQITQEVYTLCKITTTVKSEVAPLFMNDLDDIKRRVDKFDSQAGNKGVTVRLLCRPELPSDFVTFMERAVLKTMNVNATMELSKISGDPFFESYLSCQQMGPVIPPDQKKAFKHRWQIFYNLDTRVPEGIKNSIEDVFEGI